MYEPPFGKKRPDVSSPQAMAASFGWTKMPVAAFEAYQLSQASRKLLTGEATPMRAIVQARRQSQENASRQKESDRQRDAAIAAHEAKSRQQTNLTITNKANEGTEPMPAAAASKSPPKLQIKLPNVIAPNLKAFDSMESAYSAGMAVLAAVGRHTDRRNAIAEVYCRERGMQILNVATVAQPTAGGYLVPDELSKAIILNMARIGAARRLSMYMPMGSSYLSVPVERGGLTVQYISEVGTPTPTDSTWGAVSLQAEKRGVLGYTSQELNDDALVRYVDTYASRAAHALARQEDKEFVLADGTSTYGGEVGLVASIGAGGVSTAATGHDTWAELDVTDFTNAMALLPEQFADGRESWICSAAFYAQAMLRSTGGASQGFAEDGRPLFLSKPVNILPAMPTTSAAATLCCLYGNFAEAAVFGDRGLVYTISDKSPQVFANDMIAMRCFSRYDINVHNGGDATNAGAYVGLKTAA